MRELIRLVVENVRQRREERLDTRHLLGDTLIDSIRKAARAQVVAQSSAAHSRKERS